MGKYINMFVEFGKAIKEGWNESTPQKGQQQEPSVPLPGAKLRGKGSTIYTYNGTPLRKLRVGDTFEATARLGDYTLKSMYTGMVANTRDFGDVAYSYKGEIFGMSGERADEIKKLMRKGKTVTVMARIKSVNRRYGYPVIDGYFDGMAVR